MKKRSIWLFCAALALCLTVHAGGAALAGDPLPVNDWVELKAALTGGHNNDVVELKTHISGTDKADIVLTNSPEHGHVMTPIVVDKGNCTLKLNGFSVVVTMEGEKGTSAALIGVKPGAQLSIVGPGQIVDSSGACIALANNGTVEIKEATLVGSDAVYNTSQGEMTIESGDIQGARYGLVAFGKVDILGGGFASKSGSALVIASKDVTLKGGTFEAKGTASTIDSRLNPLAAYLAPGCAFYREGKAVALEGDQKKINGSVTVRQSGEAPQPGPAPEPQPEPGPAPEPQPEPGPAPEQGEFIASEFIIDQNEVKIYEGDNERVEKMDVAPYIKNDRTMLPMRFVGQALGATVDFNGETRDITLTLGARKILLNLDSNVAKVNDVVHQLENKPDNVNGRSMLPIGEIADLLGLSRATEYSPKGNLLWDGETRTVKVVIPKAMLNGDGRGA